jgi:hypothetical protein
MIYQTVIDNNFPANGTASVRRYGWVSGKMEIKLGGGK